MPPPPKIVTTITKPAPHSLVTSTITVTGTAKAYQYQQPLPNQQPLPIDRVEVRLGDAAEFRVATSSNSWSTWSFNGTTGEGEGPFNIAVRTLVMGISSTKSVQVILDKTSPAVAITSPTSNETVKGEGPAFGVWICGTAHDANGIRRVEGRVDSEAFTVAETPSDWSTWSQLLFLQGTGAHTIRVRAIDNAGNITDALPINVVAVDTGPPALRITSPTTDPIEVAWKQGASLKIAGTASDSTSQVASVQWRLGTGIFQPAQKESPDWSNWSANIVMPDPGEYLIEIRAADTAAQANSTSVIRKLVVAEPYEPTGDFVSPRAYLNDLLAFARNRLQAASAPLSDQLLATTFHQPFAQIGSSSELVQPGW